MTAWYLLVIEAVVAAAFVGFSHWGGAYPILQIRGDDSLLRSGLSQLQLTILFGIASLLIEPIAWIVIAVLAFFGIVRGARMLVWALAASRCQPKLRPRHLANASAQRLTLGGLVMTIVSLATIVAGYWLLPDIG